LEMGYWELLARAGLKLWSSQTARIIGVSHQCPAKYCYCLINSKKLAILAWIQYWLHDLGSHSSIQYGKNSSSGFSKWTFQDELNALLPLLLSKFTNPICDYYFDFSSSLQQVFR
jgi:hypothetical protein